MINLKELISPTPNAQGNNRSTTCRQEGGVLQANVIRWHTRASREHAICSDIPFPKQLTTLPLGPCSAILVYKREVADRVALGGPFWRGILQIVCSNIFLVFPCGGSYCACNLFVVPQRIMVSET